MEMGKWEMGKWGLVAALAESPPGGHGFRRTLLMDSREGGSAALG